MNYLLHYNKLIETRQELNRTKNQEIYYESHHIVPKCMGGDNSKDNLVLLTAREHYLAHLLLAKHYKTKELYGAVGCMSMAKDRRKLTSRQIERTKIYTSLANSGKNSPLFGKKRSKETKRKISKGHSGKNHYNCPHPKRVLKGNLNTSGGWVLISV